VQLTPRSALLLLLAAFPLILATWWPLLTWLTLVYILFCLSLFFLDWQQAQPISTFEIARHHDNRLSLGADNIITLTIRNRQNRPVPFRIRDEPPDPFHTTARILSGTLQRRGRWRGTYTVRPLRRGDYAFGNLNLRWTGPLGLITRQDVVPAAGPVQVFPNLLDVRRYDLLLRKNRLPEIGLRHARLLGQGTEFERLREYTPDDEYRRINWKATARRRRPITTEYQTERSQNIIAVLDTGRMMQSPVAEMAKLDYAINAVLLLGYVAGGMGDKVGLMTFADQVDTYLAPRQGRRQFYHMLERLYAVEAQPVEPDYRTGLGYLGRKQRKRALIILFTDLAGGAGMESLVSNITFLARRSLPLVVTISDPDIHAVAAGRPEDSLTVYRQVAANRLLDDRRVVLEYLERQGVLTLDVPANSLSLAVIQRYLELKGQHRL